MNKSRNDFSGRFYQGQFVWFGDYFDLYNGGGRNGKFVRELPLNDPRIDDLDTYWAAEVVEDDGTIIFCHRTTRHSASEIFIMNLDN